MNAGAHGRETKDVLVEARAVDRQRHDPCCLPLTAMHFTYRHCGVPGDWIFTEALFQGAPGDPARDPHADGGGGRVSRGQPADQGAHRRLHLQEPAGLERLEADRRRRLPRSRVGGAKVSEMHCNFLINDRTADRRRVWARRCARVCRQSGVSSNGRSSGSLGLKDGRPTGEAHAEALDE